MKLRFSIAKNNALWIVSLLLLPSTVFGLCGGDMINPVGDLCWECIFPIKIGGSQMSGAQSQQEGPMIELPDASDGNAMCTCPAPPPMCQRRGISIAFWEPAKMIETVKDPFCFPFIGQSLSDDYEDAAELYGVNEAADGNKDTANTFAQAHYMTFPVVIAAAILSVGITPLFCEPSVTAWWRASMPPIRKSWWPMSRQTRIPSGIMAGCLRI